MVQKCKYQIPAGTIHLLSPDRASDERCITAHRKLRYARTGSSQSNGGAGFIERKKIGYCSAGPCVRCGSSVFRRTSRSSIQRRRLHRVQKWRLLLRRPCARIFRRTWRSCGALGEVGVSSPREWYERLASIKNKPSTRPTDRDLPDLPDLPRI